MSDVSASSVSDWSGLVWSGLASGNSEIGLSSHEQEKDLSQNLFPHLLEGSLCPLLLDKVCSERILMTFLHHIDPKDILFPDICLMHNQVLRRRRYQMCYFWFFIKSIINFYFKSS